MWKDRGQLDLARYRKEATGGLDEVQIRNIEERRTYLVEMEARRKSILGEIRGQGKLTPSWRRSCVSAATKAELEDLYLPFKPKRRTRATIAKERGLEPLANLIWGQGRDSSPSTSAQTFVNAEKEVADVSAALAGARDICAERIAGRSPRCANIPARRTCVTARSALEKTNELDDKVTKFDSLRFIRRADRQIPSHRYLAIRRGETEGVLRAPACRSIRATW